MEKGAWAGWRLALRVGAFVAAYVLLVVVAYDSAYAAGLAAPVWWPPDGFALGVLVRAPRKAWAPLLGSLFVALELIAILGFPAERQPGPLVGMVWAASDVTVPLLGASLLRRFAGGRVSLERVREVVLFALFGTLVPSLWGAAMTLLGWYLWPGANPPFQFWDWWAAEAFGILTVAPLLLTLPPRLRAISLPRASRLAEGAALAAGLLGAAWATFGFSAPGLQVAALGSATFPLLSWAAIRFGPRGAAWAAFTLTMLCTWLTIGGSGPFDAPGEPTHERVAYVEAFFSLATFSALLLAAYASERIALHRNLRAKARENEEALALLDTVMLSSPVGIAIYDRELRFVRINDALARINGLPAELHQGRRLPEVLPGLGEEVERHIRPLLEGGRAVVGAELEGVVPSAPGEQRTFLCTWFPIEVPGRRPLGVGAMVLDVTERKRQEQALRSSEQRFRCLAEASSEIVWTRDPDGTPRRGARSWSAFTGVPVERYGPDAWQEAIHPDDLERIRGEHQEAMAAGRPFRLQYRLRRHDGAWRHMESRAVPIRGEDGAIREWVGMSLDITERVEAEAERERALEEAREAIRLRDDFLSIASHELKTPLTPLAAKLQLMQRRVARGEPIDPALLSKARDALDKLTFLINDLLDATRIREERLATRREPLELAAAVRDVGDAFRDRSDRHTLELDLPSSGIWIEGERERIVQVVDNLVDNAFKFSPLGGRVRVSIRVEGDAAKLAVSDEGIGIVPEDQERLFDRFFRARNASARSYGGLGLGLYISREIVEHHGGRIWVESEPGRGSTFFVTLPLLAWAPAGRAAPPTAEIPIEFR